MTDKRQEIVDALENKKINTIDKAIKFLQEKEGADDIEVWQYSSSSAISLPQGADDIEEVDIKWKVYFSGDDEPFTFCNDDELIEWCEEQRLAYFEDGEE